MTGRILISLIALTAMGCNVTQFFPPDEYLYQGATVEVIAPDSVDASELSTELEAAANQRVNQKIPLIGYRGIWRYYKFEEKKAENPEKYADDLTEEKGEEPIFFDETVVEGLTNLMQNRAANNGYFNNGVTYSLDTAHEDREVQVMYDVVVGGPYTLDTVSHYWRDTAVARVLTESNEETVLMEGDRYDLDALKAERQRWRQSLLDNGYFYASDNDYLFLADTVTGDHSVALLAKLKDDLPPEHLKPQRIVAVNVYPNVDPTDTVQRRGLPSFEVGGITVFCDDCPLRPEILDEGFATESGFLYNPELHRKTLRRLASYNTFRYISLDYQSEPNSDSTLILNAYMEPLPRRRIEGELGLTYNNAQYIGPNIRLAYTNRNLLRGAELLRLEGDFSYAVFLGNSDQIRVPRSGIYGLTATLDVPRLWLPKRRKLIPRVMTSGTRISLGAKVERLDLTLSKFSQEIEELDLADLETVVEEDADASETVSLLQLRASYGYTWQRRIKKSHLLNPFAVRFQNPVVSNSEVLDIARNLGLAPGQDNSGAGASRFDRMLVYSPNYTLTYDSRLDGEDVGNFFWRQYISMNWNNVFPVVDDVDAERITSVYPQLESDLRYYHNFSTSSQLALRLHGGVAFPISDRAIVPYFDLYTIGGPNSLRGFVPRQLGPGRTAPVNNNLLTFGGYGNLLLESSVEWRQKLTPLIEVAAFVDAGNVWTYKTEAEPLDTDFRSTSFVNELAMNYGFGFRFDLTFLLFRLDLAKPFQIPYEETVADFRIPRRFVGDPVEDGWRLVIGFGYPF
ncbi:outer membrane protein assembly factor BamA [Neolewinella xylanilytica]|uniref:Outer membrane protein assembly factor BamA n=1 Tax=Neolewinella xylanilytica TaxID=1514080 RepID=A0A2S6I4X4_9BACT|nr:BamA/TamA family outer membrane protein [Neolewinella xylanilytica]PPK86227.1 outer membrane protein assembly factor BamA [Neolewinella xylanilytica]